jgi:hypothetical protein
LRDFLNFLNIFGKEEEERTSWDLAVPSSGKARLSLNVKSNIYIPVHTSCQLSCLKENNAKTQPGQSLGLG